MLRRTFLKYATLGLHALVASLVGIPGVAYLLHPLRRKGAKSNFRPVVPLSALSNSQPTRVTILDTRDDAFTRHTASPIGAVWLVAGKDWAAEGSVQCFQTICPHLGCGVDFDVARGAFVCPCHASEFDPSGARRHGPSPRDLDTLECRVSSPDARGQRWVEVRYEEFVVGQSEKTPRA